MQSYFVTQPVCSKKQLYPATRKGSTRRHHLWSSTLSPLEYRTIERGLHCCFLRPPEPGRPPRVRSVHADVPSGGEARRSDWIRVNLPRRRRGEFQESPDTWRCPIATSATESFHKKMRSMEILSRVKRRCSAEYSPAQKLKADEMP